MCYESYISDIARNRHKLELIIGIVEDGAEAQVGCFAGVQVELIVVLLVAGVLLFEAQLLVLGVVDDQDRVTFGEFEGFYGVVYFGAGVAPGVAI